MTVTTVVRVAMAVVGLGCLAAVGGGLARARRKRYMCNEAMVLLITIATTGVGLIAAGAFA